jgi:hypothetical protein
MAHNSVGREPEFAQCRLHWASSIMLPRDRLVTIDGPQRRAYDGHLGLAWGKPCNSIPTEARQCDEYDSRTQLHLLLGDVDSFTAITHHDWHELRRRSSRDRRNGKFDLILFFDDEPVSQRRITSLLE